MSIECGDLKALGVVMQTVNNLPQISLDSVGVQVETLIRENKVIFKHMAEAPWVIKKLSLIFEELYMAYKNVIYVPEGHVAIANSQSPNDKIIATSKVLPWVFAVQNGSVSSLWQLLHTLTDTDIRGYYFLYEYALLKAHEVREIPDLITLGFASTRRTKFLWRKNPDVVLQSLKTLLATKVIQVKL